MAISPGLIQQLIAGARQTARNYRGATETQQHRGAVRDFLQQFTTLSKALRAAKKPMPSDLQRDYNEIVARNGMLFGGGPSGGSAESEFEAALQEFDRYVADRL
jgi:hypothetical protein